MVVLVEADADMTNNLGIVELDLVVCDGTLVSAAAVLGMNRV